MRKTHLQLPIHSLQWSAHQICRGQAAGIGQHLVRQYFRSTLPQMSTDNPGSLIVLSSTINPVDLRIVHGGLASVATAMVDSARPEPTGSNHQ